MTPMFLQIPFWICTSLSLRRMSTMAVVSDLEAPVGH
jgi:hypothetical protein